MLIKYVCFIFISTNVTATDDDILMYNKMSKLFVYNIMLSRGQLKLICLLWNGWLNSISGIPHTAISLPSLADRIAERSTPVSAATAGGI